MIRLATLALLVTFVGAPPAGAQEVFFYPSKGQSPEQLEKDKMECYSWAKGQTGFDPMTPAPTPSAAKGKAQYEAALSHYNNERATWQRAASVCMEGRDYSVN